MAKSRQRLQPKDRVRKLNRKLKKTKFKKEYGGKLPSSFALFSQSVRVALKYWRVFAGVLVIYLVLNTFFASGIGSISDNFNTIKNNINNSSPAAGLGGFLELTLTSGSVSSATSSAFQGALIIIVSLALIWGIRQLLSGKEVSLKEIFYSSMFPLIPFLLVIVWIFIQLLPVSLGSAIIASIASSLDVVGLIWTVLFSVVFCGLVAWSLYMISSSIFALYIVTLPGTMPRDALRSAKNLVRFRRLEVLRKLLFLPVSILLIMAAIILPLIMYATAFVVPVFYILSSVSLLFIHVYLYNFYRRLLD